MDKDPSQKPTFSFEFPPSFFSNSKALGEAEGRVLGGGGVIAMSDAKKPAKGLA